MKIGANIPVMHLARFLPENGCNFVRLAPKDLQETCLASLFKVKKENIIVSKATKITRTT